LVYSIRDYAFGARGLDDIISQLMAQAGQDNQPPPADKDTIRDLPKVDYDEDSMKERSPCSICQESYVDGDELTKLPCGHLFHPKW
jgi:E3 ubiquitin-protein ligase RNF115/126